MYCKSFNYGILTSFLALGVLGINAQVHAVVSPLLDEDFQADIAGTRPAGTTQFVVYSRPSGGDTANSQVKIIDGSPEPEGPFGRAGNLCLKFVAATSSDFPSFFIRNQLTSGVVATNDGRFAARVFINQPANSASPILKFNIGSDTSGNSALTADEQTAQVDFLANGHLQIRTGSGIYTSDQTFTYDQMHNLVVDFTTGSTGTFTVRLDDAPITASGNGTFTAQSVTTYVNAAYILAQGVTGGVTAYVDDVFLTDGRGVTYYVAPNGNDVVSGTDPNNPLASPGVAVGKAGPGDTIHLAAGKYRLPNTLDNFSTATTPSTRITLRGDSDQNAIITTMEDMHDINLWTPVAYYPHVFEHDGRNEIPGSPTPLFRHVTQDGVTLRLMTPNEGFVGSPADLTGPGQWTRNNTEGKIYVWAYGGENPGQYDTEVSRRYATVYLNVNGQNGTGGNNYITLRDLAIEGSYYPVSISGHYVEVIHCKVSNAFADDIKADIFPLHALIEDCNLYHMGESGVDATGGSYWTIRGNHIHDGWPNRIYGTKVNGIMLKYGIQHTLVENNVLTNLDTKFGAITIGGTSSSNPAIEAQYLTVRNNIMSRVSGPYIVAFLSAQDCVFTGNTIQYCQVYHASPPYVLTGGLIEWSSNDGSNNTHPSQNNTITNNVLHNPDTPNEANYTYFEYAAGNHSGTVSGNVVDPARYHAIFVGGVRTDESSGYFPNDLDPQ